MPGYANTNRQTTSRNEAYLKLIGEILKSPNPFYYLCECAHQWAEIAGLEIYIVYEKARKGTAFETVPFQVYSHKEWVEFKLKQKASTKS